MEVAEKMIRMSFLSFSTLYWIYWTTENTYSLKIHFYLKKQNIRAGSDMMLADSHIKCYDVA